MSIKRASATTCYAYLLAVLLAGTCRSCSITGHAFGKKEMAPRALSSPQAPLRIGIALPTCSCGKPWRAHHMLDTVMLPSLALSLTGTDPCHYMITVYVGLLDTDPMAHDGEYQRRVASEFRANATSVGVPADIEFHKFPAARVLPRICFNEVAAVAYRAGNEYIVRAIDDVKFTSTGWVDLAVRALQNLHPPNLGVAGPVFAGGRWDIFAIVDVTHRTHHDIFGAGSRYPPIFTNWYMDDWITFVYGGVQYAGRMTEAEVAQSHSVRVKNWTMLHAGAIAGNKERYTPAEEQRTFLRGRIDDGKKAIAAWLAHKQDEWKQYRDRVVSNRSA